MNRSNGQKTINKDRAKRPIPTLARNDVQIKKFEETINREKLETFLGQSDKYEGFLAALRSPIYSKHSMAKIMEKFGVTLHDLVAIYRDGNRNMGLFAMADHLPKIMEDVSVDAESKEVVCGRCDGDGFVEGNDGEPKDCPLCQGKTTVRQIGDKHARDLVFESMGLTAVKGPMVAIQQNFAAGKGGEGLNSTLEDTLRLTQSITMGEKKEVAE